MNNKRLNLLPVWAAISAVIIIAGIVLMALLGFNDSLDRSESKNFDVYYNVVVDLSEERKATLEGYCEDAFAAQGIAYEEKTTLSGQTDPVSQNQSSFTGTGNDFVLRYTFSADVSDEALAAAKGYASKFFACEFLPSGEGRIADMGASVAAVVGSEGGFSEEEYALAADMGYTGISLGRRILRAETAAVALLSVIMYEAGELR